MAARAARKILKEREILQAASSTETPKQHQSGSESESEEVEAPFAARKPNAFEMLMAAGDDGQEEEEEEQEQAQPVQVQKAENSSKKKQKKKNKKKKEKEETAEVDDFSDFERALKEVDDKFGKAEEAQQPLQQQQLQPKEHKRGILDIDLKLLDADAEMRKLFGSKIMQEAQAELRGKRNMNVRRRQLAAGFDGKTYLVKPREQWPRIPSKVGISMNMLQAPSKVSDPEQVPGYFEFGFSPAYSEIQMMFQQCVNTHDPGTINNLLNAYPFHIDALLQCSEVAKHNGDINTAAEYIERALFVFERAFHPLFNMALANSILPYSYAENRAFFLALSRHIGFVSRKGCWRTCLELSKLLFSLDPEDPLGALQMMDWFAIKAGERSWVKRCWQEWGGDQGAIEGLPNWSFSIALAEFEEEIDLKNENHEVSTKRLEEAMKQYPEMVPLLLTKLTLTDPTVTNSSLFSANTSSSTNDESIVKSTEAIRLLLQLYVDRCHHLWKEPTALAWFRSTATRLATTTSSKDAELESFEQKRNSMYPVGLQLNVSRHIYVSDFAHLVPFLPEEARALPLNAFDPMPPPAEEGDDEGGNDESGGVMGWIMQRLQQLVGADRQAAAEEDETDEDEDVDDTVD
ncbi:transcriptional repressor TCF25-domain-containing protein [Obelidium mucronatum]|nr:transcriptional repressor TCF25-domain-containing protein [Obelidium mucronatum]